MTLSRPAGTKDSHSGDMPRSIKLTICAEPQLRQLGPPAALSAATVFFSTTPISLQPSNPWYRMRRSVRSLPFRLKKTSSTLFRLTEPHFPAGPRTGLLAAGLFAADLCDARPEAVPAGNPGLVRQVVQVARRRRYRFLEQLSREYTILVAPAHDLLRSVVGEFGNECVQYGVCLGALGALEQRLERLTALGENLLVGGDEGVVSLPLVATERRDHQFGLQDAGIEGRQVAIGRTDLRLLRLCFAGRRTRRRRDDAGHQGGRAGCNHSPAPGVFRPHLHLLRPPCVA